MISHFINEPDHWRARAEEARMLANQMNDSESRDAMLRIAEDYERLAKSAKTESWGVYQIGRNISCAIGTPVALFLSCKQPGKLDSEQPEII